MEIIKRKWRNVVAVAICLTVGANLFAQERAIRIMKDGFDVFAYELSGTEKIVFKDPAGATTPASTDALIVKKASGETVRTLLDDIKEITMADGLLSVVPYSGTTAVYALSSVTLLFDYDVTGVISPQAAKNGVKVWINSAGEIRVESAEGILSLSLFSLEGRLIAQEQCSPGGGGVLTSTSWGNSVSGLPPGMYFLRVETTQMPVFKKLVINH